MHSTFGTVGQAQHGQRASTSLQHRQCHHAYQHINLYLVSWWRGVHRQADSPSFAAMHSSAAARGAVLWLPVICNPHLPPDTG